MRVRVPLIPPAFAAISAFTRVFNAMGASDGKPVNAKTARRSFDQFRCGDCDRAQLWPDFCKPFCDPRHIRLAVWRVGSARGEEPLIAMVRSRKVESHVGQDHPGAG